MYSVYLFFHFDVSIGVLHVDCHAGPHEKRLLHQLLDHYNVLERPVVNESDPLQLSFGLTLMQIIDVVRLILFLFIPKSQIARGLHLTQFVLN